MSPLVRDAVDAAVEAAATVTEWPAVSVIVPVYNGAEFLREGLESVLAQSVPPREVIVVDDGSTDASAEIAADVAATHPEVRVLRRPNGGPGAARNDGIDAATGAFLVFHDADDLMLPERIALQVGYLLTHDGASAVIGSTALRFEPGTDLDAALVRRELADRGERINLMVMAARAAAFAEVGGFDPSYRQSEDVNWITRAARHGLTVAFVPSVVVERRIHPGNVSHAMDDARREAFRSLLEHIRARRTD